MVLAGKDAGFGFGDDAILVGVATAHRLVELLIFPGFDGVYIFEDERDEQIGAGFPAGHEGHFAQGFVEDATGCLIFENHFGARGVVVGCFRTMDAAGQAKCDRAGQQATQG